MSYRFSASSPASGVTPTPPVLESRASTRGAESFHPRTDSAKSRLHSPLPQVLEGDGTTEEEKQNLDSDVGKEALHNDGRPPLHASSKRSTGMKDRIISMDSEASGVYTRNISRLSDAHQSTRPAPLNPTQQPSPLLHTSWGSGPSSSTCGKWVHVPRFLGVIIGGVYRCTKGLLMTGMGRLHLCLARRPRILRVRFA